MQTTPHASGTLAGRVILIVGAQGGLGAAAAVACAAQGASLVLLGRSPRKLGAVYDACARQGSEPFLYPLDLEGATPEDLAALAERIGSELGALHGVLHCAAEFRGLTPLEQTDPAVFARAIHVNLTARWWLTQACLPLLRAAEDAAVVFAMDDPARVGEAYWGGYGVAHHGMVGLVSMLHAELASSHVRVSGLQLPPMRTALRGRAYADDHQGLPVDRVVPACVHLLSAAGADHRGDIWKLPA
ncbi:SDR family NAD(P)-dependent oxidoreductase [Pseudoxanthomonas composti]|uniref:SDR family NAD(P)-dependent oxidoreductase n=2 Tax=Pseudoxanthomonas composti TaxID=2137479 RepID=A0A4Q1JYX7_9GAMM|nr:SDR family NAD(P)-dependent oxidoreductase [Pseudoxanthomonas composti]RXR08534.1 SDR family NAD(P)-dependent oxidoreductase [Pseudoxanthomonas composti]